MLQNWKTISGMMVKKMENYIWNNSAKLENYLEKWWKTRNQQGEVGHVPHTIVNPFESAPSYRGPSPPHKGSRAEYRHY